MHQRTLPGPISFGDDKLNYKALQVAMVRYGFTRGKEGLVDSEAMVSLLPKEDDGQVIAGAEEPPTVTQVDQRAFRDGYEPKEGDMFLAVLGVTGAGKSTFISKCTDKEVSIGHNLQACTQEVGVFLCKHRGVNVYLIDTPGFDDTDRSDTEVSLFTLSADIARFKAAI